MLSVIYADSHLCCVTYKRLMMSGIMLNVVTLSVVMLSVVILSVVAPVKIARYY